MIFTYFQKICKLDSQICVLECTDSAAITKEQHPPKFMELFYLKDKSGSILAVFVNKQTKDMILSHKASISGSQDEFSWCVCNSAELVIVYHTNLSKYLF